jgi:NitT/TauT family transport system substrate-binding protein
MTILARAGREYCQAYHHGPNRQEMAATLVKHKILNDPAMIDRMAWQARDPNGRINIDSLVDEEEWFNRFGMLPKAAPREKLADPSYAEAAAKELGPFEVANKDSKLGGCR